MECNFLLGTTTMIRRPLTALSQTMEDGGSGNVIEPTLTVCMVSDRRKDYLG